VTDEATAGLVQKGGAYPVTESVDERTYAVNANPPDTWEMQKDTVLEQYKLDTGNDGEVLSAEPDHPMGVVNVTVGPADSAEDEEAKAPSKNPPKTGSGAPPPKK